MSAEPREDPVEELVELAQALRAHAEWQASTGATGLERASAELRAEREAAAPAEPAPRAEAPASAPRRREAGSLPSPSAAVAERPPPAEPTRRVAEPAPAPASGPSAGQAASAVPDEQRAKRLELLATEVSGCTRCPLHEARTQTVFSRGTSSSGLCFIGEGPGADEDAQGYPFVGKAGQLLDRMIAAMGFERDEVYVCNIVKCRPPENRKPTPEEMAACMPYLEKQLELVEPSVIVAMGATAVQGLLGTTGGITRMRGKWRLYKGRIAVMPTFHPAYLLRTPRAKRDVWEDLQAVLRQMGHPIPSRS